MDLLFLQEELFAPEHMVFERKDDGKNLYMDGILMQGVVLNRNNRSYPKTEMVRAVENINSRLAAGKKILGEIDHPETLSLNLKHACLQVMSARMEGNDVVGKIKILNNANGKLVEDLIADGIIPGVSSRGTGNLNTRNEVENFQFETLDIVAQPSAPKAYPSPLREALINDINNLGKIHCLEGVNIQDILGIDIDLTKKEVQKQLAYELKAFISSLKS